MDINGQDIRTADASAWDIGLAGADPDPYAETHSGIGLAGKADFLSEVCVIGFNPNIQRATIDQVAFERFGINTKRQMAGFPIITVQVQEVDILGLRYVLGANYRRKGTQYGCKDQCSY